LTRLLGALMIDLSTPTQTPTHLPEKDAKKCLL
jgi:hypothetical protein